MMHDTISVYHHNKKLLKILKPIDFSRIANTCQNLTDYTLLYATFSVKSPMHCCHRKTYTRRKNLLRYIFKTFPLLNFFLLTQCAPFVSVR